ncbi:zinc finger protein 474 [Clonorchis sinensis]|uniref:Zinc finger protein 474 n=1 Tax=Clonorchis sinensis TaxID=79923 RepID=G7YXJ0_CLOSI|nr:zinc finger protein 474 [Clonorchis sinensis]
MNHNYPFERSRPNEHKIRESHCPTKHTVSGTQQVGPMSNISASWRNKKSTGIGDPNSAPKTLGMTRLSSSDSTKEVRTTSITISDTEPKTSTISSKKSSQSLIQVCPICSRFYGLASIDIHRRACQLADELHRRQMEAKQAWDNKLVRRPSHPPGTLCHICGRRYTHASLSLHIPRCLKQWILWNKMLPKRRQHRQIPITPTPTNEELQERVEKAHRNGLTYYALADALDEIMLEASLKNKLPVELIHTK